MVLSYFSTPSVSFITLDARGVAASFLAEYLNNYSFFRYNFTLLSNLMLLIWMQTLNCPWFKNVCQLLVMLKLLIGGVPLIEIGPQMQNDLIMSYAYSKLG